MRFNIFNINQKTIGWTRSSICSQWVWIEILIVESDVVILKWFTKSRWHSHLAYIIYGTNYSTINSSCSLVDWLTTIFFVSAIGENISQTNQALFWYVLEAWYALQCKIQLSMLRTKHHTHSHINMKSCKLVNLTPCPFYELVGL